MQPRGRRSLPKPSSTPRPRPLRKPLSNVMRLNWFSQPSKNTPASAAGRLLARAAPSWRYSPSRRIVQTLSLLAFLVLFLYVCLPYTAAPAKKITGTESNTETETNAEAWPSHYADDILQKQVVPAELFLAIDPLVSISTAIAARTLVWSLSFAGVLLLACLIVPRGFCGYICPLGTLIDLFDWIIGRRVGIFKLSGNGWYIHLKYYLLATVIVSAFFGILISGFFAAIPVVTRAAAYTLTPLETGLVRSWHQIPAINAGQILSLVLFASVLGLGLLKPRFWCSYICPTGAVFSIANLLRLTERKVEHSCIKCGKCIKACDFDAIEPDFTTRTADCTFCQTCGGACPTAAINFVPRWQALWNTQNDESGATAGLSSSVIGTAGQASSGTRKKGYPRELSSEEKSLGRRGFLTATIALFTGAISGFAAAKAIQETGAQLGEKTPYYPVRPPGSVPEEAFLQMCIRCGECLQACPNDVLQPQAFEQGAEGLWTPRVNANWSGCEPSCNNCCQVCPTGAIRDITLAEKRVARMGLAEVDQDTCLPYAGKEECQLCVDECAASGYGAIEFMTVGTETDERGIPIEGTGMLAPVVLAEKCVGCGLCQTRCYAINVKTKRLLSQSAIIIEAGPGKEDRIMSGSYLALRAEEQRQRKAQRQEQADNTETDGDSYLPDFLK
ncbi:MAG: 4Fe-4S binding protein [Pirellulales bacterium]|nr:4Fe-4S binding protein [Pirellulales bacterium]